ncbi:MAG: hypothetical protein EXR71_04820 [Myxococcales bacterium]|nr:hypothetical protein [Myxococcales bacterium]
MIGRWALSGALGCAVDSATALKAGLRDRDCSAIVESGVKDQCLVELVQCEAIVGARARAECAFRDAEATGNAARCVDAGEWVDDCRMHLWTASFGDWAPADAGPGQADDLAARELVRFGFSTADPRPWSAWYRWLLGRSRPLDRDACRTIADPARSEACLKTGLAYYDDLLNMARDRKLYPCDGSSLPAVLEHAPDAELDALVARRTDLCP